MNVVLCFLVVLVEQRSIAALGFIFRSFLQLCRVSDVAVSVVVTCGHNHVPVRPNVNCIAVFLCGRCESHCQQDSCSLGSRPKKTKKLVVSTAGRNLFTGDALTSKATIWNCVNNSKPKICRLRCAISLPESLPLGYKKEILNVKSISFGGKCLFVWRSPCPIPEHSQFNHAGKCAQTPSRSELPGIY